MLCDPHAPADEGRKNQATGLRTGFTTGACAAAAARAAARYLLTAKPVTQIEITLPNGNPAGFAVSGCELLEGLARCTVVKDGGDDPDCTHGAEIVALVELRRAPGVELRGGKGVATVTKPGLGLDIGAPAINPVPRRNIAEMVLAELTGTAYRGAAVTISVPRGEEIARSTLNARLGLKGGISILGTTGIVRPFSTAAWQASVVQSIDVARAEGQDHLVFSTGGRTDRFAMALFPRLPQVAFIQVGDEVGLGLRHAVKRGATQATMVAMVGKLAKMAVGAMQTHVSRSTVDTQLLSALARSCGASPALATTIRGANTARHALELADAAGLHLAEEICRLAADALKREAGPTLGVRAVFVDFHGAVRASHPPLPVAA